MGCIGPSIVVLQFESLYKLSSVRERLPEPIPKRTNRQQTVSANTLTHQQAPPHHLPVPLRGKKESNQSSRRIFFFLQSSTIQPLNTKKSQKEGFVWEGGKPRTLVVSENMFRCLYMSEYVLFDMCIALHLSMLPCSLFSNIYIKASKKVY